MTTGPGPHLPIELPFDTRQEDGDVQGFEKRHDQTHRGMGKARSERLAKLGGATDGHMRRNENL